jgi:hypothetical protein
MRTQCVSAARLQGSMNGCGRIATLLPFRKDSEPQGSNEAIAAKSLGPLAERRR